MKRPAEIGSLVAAIVAFLVQIGVLDEPTSAWITLGVGLVAAFITAGVEWFRKRPNGGGS